MSFSLKIKATREELPLLLQVVDDWCQQQELDYGSGYAVQLVLEELATNTVLHSVPVTGEEIAIEIKIDKSQNNIKIEYSDNAQEFNPLSSQTPDINLPVEDRKVGGLGIFLLKKTMDTVDYAYRDNHNVVTMTKIMKK